MKRKFEIYKERLFNISVIDHTLISAQTITDANYADDIALMANTPTLFGSLLHSLEKATGCIGLDVSVDNTVNMLQSKSDKRHLHPNR